jgi:hypothetical protein
MKIDFMVPFRRTPTAPIFAVEPFREPQGRAPRISRMLLVQPDHRRGAPRDSERAPHLDAARYR